MAYCGSNGCGVRVSGFGAAALVAAPRLLPVSSEIVDLTSQLNNLATNPIANAAKLKVESIKSGSDTALYVGGALALVAAVFLLK